MEKKKFRIFENECLEKNLNGKQCIFSMGGGAILNEKIDRYLRTQKHFSISMFSFNIQK